eukprot:3506487-Rhodomonas_salina.1
MIRKGVENPKNALPCVTPPTRSHAAGAGRDVACAGAAVLREGTNTAWRGQRILVGGDGLHHPAVWPR